MQDLAKGIYESTPGINDEVPRHTSKILHNVQPDLKKMGGMALLIGKGGQMGELTLDMKYEDWQRKYEDILREYKN